MSRAYYNEIDPYACEWLRNLIAGGLIAPGDVDERSIADVRPDDLRGYTQCHFFAGIAGWSLALRLAGWPDDRPVWTGSCPCQPFSAAGKQQGEADERHLWPEFRRLIAECNPATVFGEQVASKLGRAWLAAVRADLEALGYAVGAADLCAAGTGAPHIRQRLWFVADRSGERWERREGISSRREHDGQDARRLKGNDGFVGFGEARAGKLANAERDPRDECAQRDGEKVARQQTPCGADVGGSDGLPCTVEHAESEQVGLPRRAREPGSASPWSDCLWLPCADGKQRPTQPGIFPLAHGVPARVAKLRAAGNAIAPQVAAEFIKACVEI